MTKRMIVMLAVVGVVLAGLAAIKARQVQAAIAQFQSFRPPPEAVTTLEVASESWPATLASIGTVTAVHGVTVTADLPGVVERIAFDSGRHVRQGELLVELDTRQEQAQLAAAEAQRDLARLQLERMRDLRAKGVTSQEELDRAEAAARGAEAAAREIGAAIARKTIRAPFAGELGIRQVNLGQYLTAGEPVVPLQSLDPIYVDFSVPQQEVRLLQVGHQVALGGDGGAPGGRPLRGSVTAIDSIVDAATRNVRVQARFANPDGLLRPGMFVEVAVDLGAATEAVAVPASAIHHAPYGASVFVVEELTAPDGVAYLGVRQQFVSLGGARGDRVAVVAGLAPGEEVVTSGVFKLSHGAAVAINNEVQPGNDPAPRPANS